MRFELRAARPAEAEDLVPLYEWLFAPPGAPAPDWNPRRAAVALRQAIDSHDAVVLVAEAPDPPAPRHGAGGSLVGLCVAYQDIHSVRYGYRAWVEDLAVSPEHRSAGIGKALLDAAKAWARERGATHLELDTGHARSDAQRFYERERPDWHGITYTWRL